MHDVNLSALVALLLPLARRFPTITFYVFGSRVRGDHRPDSDIDVFADTDKAETCGLMDWQIEEGDGYPNAPDQIRPLLRASCNNQAEGLKNAIRSAEAAPQSRENVVCVWLPPKP